MGSFFGLFDEIVGGGFLSLVFDGCLDDPTEEGLEKVLDGFLSLICLFFHQRRKAIHQ